LRSLSKSCIKTEVIIKIFIGKYCSFPANIIPSLFSHRNCKTNSEILFIAAKPH
jgi:hypothetical protein